MGPQLAYVFKSVFGEQYKCDHHIQFVIDLYFILHVTIKWFQRGNSSK